MLRMLLWSSVHVPKPKRRRKRQFAKLVSPCAAPVSPSQVTVREPEGWLCNCVILPTHGHNCWQRREHRQRNDFAHCLSVQDQCSQQYRVSAAKSSRQFTYDDKAEQIFWFFKSSCSQRVLWLRVSSLRRMCVFTAQGNLSAFISLEHIGCVRGEFLGKSCWGWTVMREANHWYEDESAQVGTLYNWLASPSISE